MGMTINPSTGLPYEIGLDESEADLLYVKKITEDRTLPTTVNDCVDIGSFTIPNGGLVLDISLIVSNSGVSLSKKYLLTIQYAGSVGAWKLAPILSDSGQYSGQDIALDINVNNDTCSLRIRRTSGATPGTVRAVILPFSIETYTFTASSSITSVTPPTDYYEGIFLRLNSSGNIELTKSDSSPTWASFGSNSTSDVFQIARNGSLNTNNLLGAYGDIIIAASSGAVSTAAQGLRVKTNGYVGINLPGTSPSHPLHVGYTNGSGYRDAVYYDPTSDDGTFFIKAAAPHSQTMFFKPRYPTGFPAFGTNASLFQILAGSVFFEFIDRSGQTTIRCSNSLKIEGAGPAVPTADFGFGTILRSLATNIIVCRTIGSAGQTEPLQTWENSSGSVLSNIDENGAAHFNNISTSIVTKTANYTIVLTDSTILCDATSGAITITLPTAASSYYSTNKTGRIFTIKKIDSSVNAITIDANGAETIDGALTQSLSTQWQSITIQSNGTSWFIIGKN